MSILYAIVARGEAVLAEHSTISGNAHLVAHRILERLSQDDQRVSYSQERHLFHIFVSKGITFLCMADEGFGRRLPFGFLEDISHRFFSSYGSSASTAPAYAYDTDFSLVLGERMTYWSSNPQADAIGKVNHDISEVKGLMVQNIEKALNRGEKIELLVTKTDALQEESFAFRRDARVVRRTFWWKNARLACTAFLLLLSLMYIIFAFFCGPFAGKCFGR